MSSRNVALTTTFLLLAAGGVAACDSSNDANSNSNSNGSGSGIGSGNGSGDERFYCADDQGNVVDEDYCDDDDSYHGGPGFFIWHSSGYRSGYPIGSRLPAGGSRFAYKDTAARQLHGLPSSGKIGNGTVKSSVVGKGGAGTSGSSKSGSGSSSNSGSGSSFGSGTSSSGG